MKKIVLILTLVLLTLISEYTYTMNNHFAGDEDLPRVFLITEIQHGVSSRYISSVPLESINL